jgi:hypothetical protein
MLQGERPKEIGPSLCLTNGRGYDRKDTENR